MSIAPDAANLSALAHEPESSRHAARVPMSTNWIWRPLSGILLALLAVGATIWGGWAFLIFLSAGCTAAVREWHRLFARDYLIPTVVTASAMVLALILELNPSVISLPHAIALLLVLTAGALLNFLIGIATRQEPFASAAAVGYIAVPALTLLMIRQSAPHPIWTVVFIFLVVWATDTGALFAGKLIGGPKLAPRLSPGKTWAGSVGGLLCAAGIATILAILLHARILPAMIFGLVLSLVGQTGDLFESLIKRKTGCKDSGGLIPGHGGVLDRIDSMLFAAPVAAVLIFLANVSPIAAARF